MKKLLLTASILAVSAGSAFAQTVTPIAPTTNFVPPDVQLSDITQNGADNTATVDQTGGSEGVSDINQNGEDNLAEVTQSEVTGASNTFNTPGNVADIDQVGDNARARIEQTSTNAGSGSNEALNKRAPTLAAAQTKL